MRIRSHSVIYPLVTVLLVLSGCRSSLDASQNEVEDQTLLPNLTYSATSNVPLLINSSVNIAPAFLESRGGPVTTCGILEGTRVLPQGLAVNPRTCVIFGVPTVITANTTYTIIARNTWGSSEVAKISLSTLPAPPYLSYLYPNSRILNAGINGTLIPQLLDNGSPIQSCRIKPGTTPASLPGSLVINNTTCVITGIGVVSSPATYTIQATNALGSTDALLTLQVNGPPIVTFAHPSPISPYVGQIGVPINVAPTIVSNGSAIRTCGIRTGTTPLPSWASIHPTTCAFSGTPQTLPKTTFTLIASNASGFSADIPFSLMIEGPPTLDYGTSLYVATKNQPFSVTPTLSKNVTSNTLTGCVIKSTNPPGTALPGLVLSTTDCSISGTPTDNTATATFSIAASNSYGQSATADFKLKVAGIPQVTYSPNPFLGSIGTAFSTTSTTSVLIDNNDPVTNCRVTSTPALPSSLYLNPTSCQISGTPQSGEAQGNTNYSIVATNRAGNSTPATFILSIVAGVPSVTYPPPPIYLDKGVIGSIQALTRSNGMSITGCAIRAGTLNLPGNLTVGSTSCHITGIPTTKSLPKTYTIVAINGTGPSADSFVTFGIRGGPDLAYASTPISSPLAVPINILPTLFETYGTDTTCSIVGSVSSQPVSGVTVNASTCAVHVDVHDMPTETAFTVNATNSFDTAQAFFTLNLTAVAPELSYDSTQDNPIAFRMGEAQSVPPSLLHIHGAPVTCSFASSTPPPHGLNVNPTTCALEGTLNILLPTLQYTIIAHNSQGDTEASVFIKTVPNRPTLSYVGSTGTTISAESLTSIPPKILYTNGAAIQQCKFVSGETLTSTISGAGISIENTNCVIQGTPLTTGTYTVQVRNGISTGNPAINYTEATVTITVTPAVPLLTFQSETSATIGVSASISGPLKHRGAAVTLCSVTPALPTGLSIAPTPTTCVITGTPTIATPTYYDLVITATNSVGNSLPAATRLTISAGPPTISFSSPSIVGTAKASMGPYTPTLVNNGAAVTTCSSTPTLPAGLSIAPTTCIISGTPSAVTAGPQIFQIRAGNPTLSTPFLMTIDISAVDPVLTYPSVSPKYYLGATASIAADIQSGGEPIASCTSSPGLPPNLILDNTNCNISGTLAEPNPAPIPSVSPTPIGYTVTASTSGHRFGSATITFSVGYQWIPTRNDTSTPGPRYNHVAVWDSTENRMIVWGGNSDPNVYLNSGGVFKLSSQSWTLTSLDSAPLPRAGATAVWTGSKMIVWGGHNATTYFHDGGIYDPSTNSWTAMNTTNAPSARVYHTAIWTGSEMVVVGGFNGSTSFSDGGRFDPGTGTWTPFSGCLTSITRYNHSAVWSGTEMLVWGGQDMNGPLNSGYRWTPGGGCNGTPISTGTNVPGARFSHTAAWMAGTTPGMMIWSGAISPTQSIATGGFYNPATNTWSVLPTVGAPPARAGATAVVSSVEANKAFIWGGAIGTQTYSSGDIYDSNANTWTSINSVGGPPPRVGHTAIWNTGSPMGMIIWGGLKSANTSDNSGWLYLYP